MKYEKTDMEHIEYHFCNNCRRKTYSELNDHCDECYAELLGDHYCNSKKHICEKCYKQLEG